MEQRQMMAMGERSARSSAKGIATLAGALLATAAAFVLPAAPADAQGFTQSDSKAGEIGRAHV